MGAFSCVLDGVKRALKRLRGVGGSVCGTREVGGLEGAKPCVSQRGGEGGGGERRGRLPCGRDRTPQTGSAGVVVPPGSNDNSLLPRNPRTEMCSFGPYMHGPTTTTSQARGRQAGDKKRRLACAREKLGH